MAKNDPMRLAALLALAVVLGCGSSQAPTDDAAVGADAARPDAARLDGGGDGADAGVADASTDGGGSADDASSGGDSGLWGCTTATAASDCDDHDPRTSDMCLTIGHTDGTGTCVWIECSIDTECDDSDSLTYDSCDTFALRCVHTLYPNRCHAGTDCVNALTPTCVSAACDARALCRYDWPLGCGLADPVALPSCSAVGAVEGATCCDGPTCEPLCVIAGGSTDCTERLQCASSGPGLAERYRRIEPAGGSCTVAPDCPSAPPTAAASCPTLGVVCDYDLRPLDVSADAPSTHRGAPPRCECTAGGWSCVGDPCPATPPTDGDSATPPSWYTSPGRVCEYLGTHCMSRYDAAGALHWRCVVPILCPRRISAPTTTEACLVGADDHCSYSGRLTAAEPATTYSGSCDCQADGTWTCTPSRSAACPATQPVAAAMCTREPGNDQCAYFSADGTRIRCSCTGGAPGLPGAWSCS